MPSTRDLRRRIKSIKATRQITKAMELVSASKMRKAVEATLASRPYADRSQEVLADLISRPIEGLSHPLIEDQPATKTLVLVISSDRGLAGSYGTNLVKRLSSLIEEQTAAGRTTGFITIGRQLEHVLVRLNATIVQSYSHTSTHPTAADIKPISDYLTQAFLDGSYDQILALYTGFRSLLTQEAEVRQILPIRADTAHRFGKPKKTAATDEANPDPRFFVYEPTPIEVLDAILPRLIEAQVYQFLQESLASEHAARRMAMQSASTNADDMIDDLSLTYNGLRQGTITRELAEISSASDSLNESN